MECSICKIEKLPNEFALKNISEKCAHPALFCLRCTIGSVKDTSKCPYPGCNSTANLTDERLAFFQSLLNDLFKAYDDGSDTDAEQEMPSIVLGGSLTVSLLTGESITVPFKANMEVVELKQKVRSGMGHNQANQKLIYKGIELKDFKDNGSRTKLCDFSVKPNSTINLIVLLFAIPDNLNDVVFDIGWNYPATGNQWLDAIAFFYSGMTYRSFSDYADVSQPTPGRVVPGIKHTGDVWDKRTGHQIMYISLKDLPQEYTHMFIVVTAYEGYLNRFPSPRLRFYDTANPSKDLCKTSYRHAFSSKSVIMCYMTRKYGQWELYESGKLCAGTFTDHAPMKVAINEILRSG